MHSKLILQVLYLLVLTFGWSHSANSDGKCLMSGVCGESMYGYIPCAKQSDHHKFENDTVVLDILRNECPELFSDGVQFPEVCCSADELKRLQNMVGMLDMVMPGCPSCSANFKEIFCHLTCAPNQDQFMDVVSKGKNKMGQEMVREINYYVSKSFGAGTFEACKDVLAMGQSVKSMVCKGNDPTSCTFGNLFKFLGNDRKRKGYAPYQINFVFDELKSVEANGKKFNVAQLDFSKCSEATRSGGKACPCALCPSSC